MSGARRPSCDGGARDRSFEPGTIRRRTFVKAIGTTGIAVGLAGCSSGGDTKRGDHTTLQFVTHSDWANIQETVNQQLHDAGMPADITVKMVTAGTTTDNTQTKYRQWLAAERTEPDILTFDSGWTIPFILRDQLLNLEKTLPKDLLEKVHSEYFQTSVGSATDHNGDLYAVPIYPDFPTIQYRKDLVSDAGYDWEQYRTKAMSWEQFSHELKDAYEQSDVQYGYNWQAVAAEQLSCCVFNEYLSSWGGSYFGDPTKNLYENVGERPVTVGEQPVIDSLKMARTFIQGTEGPNTLNEIAGDISPSAVLQWDVEPSRKPFTNGNAVALRNWPYSIRVSGAESALGDKQGVMPMPYGVPEGKGNYSGTGGSIAAMGGWHVGINPHSERIDACIEFLKAMTTKDFMKTTFETTGWMPPIPSVLRDSSDIPIMGEHIETLAFAGKHSMPRPVTVLWPSESKKIEQQANAALGGMPPKQAMEQLANQLATIENLYRGDS